MVGERAEIFAIAVAVLLREVDPDGYLWGPFAKEESRVQEGGLVRGCAVAYVVQ
jgi:hypothetical protein